MNFAIDYIEFRITDLLLKKRKNKIKNFEIKLAVQKELYSEELKDALKLCTKLKERYSEKKVT